VSAGVYLPKTVADGLTVTITTGNAAVYAGLPDAASHRFVTSISTGGSYTIAGLSTGEVVSVQSDYSFAFTVSGGATPPPPPPPPTDPLSSVVSWNCTGTPCPWGSTLTGNALVWDASAGAGNTRLGYTTSKSIYLPSANGVTVNVTEGTAAAYAGLPDAPSHRFLATIQPGQSYVVTGLASGEVVSVQADSAFRFLVTYVAGPPPPPPPPPPSSPSSAVSWTCTGSPCPWGSSLTGQALVWPISGALTSRLGYTTSAGVYLPANVANGATVQIVSGTASVYAGLPAASSHRLVSTLDAGQSAQITGLVDDEVVSVQSDGGFTFSVTPSSGGSGGTPSDVMNSVSAVWRNSTWYDEWVGSVITWPSSTAYESNARSGYNNRTVYSTTGQLLYPYMGPWANGCVITARSGNVLIIEWQRGTDVWRSTLLTPGQVHTIQLVSPENNVLIETEDNSTGAFNISVSNCTPQAVPK
jgi:hypothetical protein